MKPFLVKGLNIRIRMRQGGAYSWVHTSLSVSDEPRLEVVQSNAVRWNSKLDMEWTRVAFYAVRLNSANLGASPKCLNEAVKVALFH